MSRPWMPLYIGEYHAQTMHLGARECGALILLMLHYWQHGKIPTQSPLLAKVCRCNEREWKDIAEIISWPEGDLGKALARIMGRCVRIIREPIDSSIRDSVFARDGEKCTYCGSETGPFHLDHIYPVIRGGGSSAENLTVACAACNLSKGRKTPGEWRQ